ncbi:MAG: tyrosine-protein kinase family protein [Gammaproteobacteria bacterium]|nr:MAG: tyrosine-protein kinase family protein [Gammaproteobacteria bacterium]
MSTIEDAIKKHNKGNLEVGDEKVNSDELDQAAELQRIASEYEDELNPEEFWHGGSVQATKTDTSPGKIEQNNEKEASESESASSVGGATDKNIGPGLHKIDFRHLQRNHIITPDDNESCLIEEFRAIKRPLLNNAFGQVSQEVKNSNIIMVTSAMPGEGKTFTSLNLAMSMATEMDTTVLLVDADIPRPSISEFLGLDQNLPGLIDILLDDQVDMSNVLVKTNIDNLVVLPAGRGHSNATEIMASSSMSTLMTEISQRYNDRVIILDSPPLLITSEAKVLAEKVGQVVMVVESDLTSQEHVKQAVEMLDDNDIVNLVLNKSRSKSSQPYYGSYSRYKDY